jgi:tetratricopeptide (TPR) repeat protein
MVYEELAGIYSLQLAPEFLPDHEMNPSRLLSLTFTLVLGACAQQAVQPGDASLESSAKPAAVKPRVVTLPPVATPSLPKMELSQSILFRLLLADIALQRGQSNVAVQAFLELARETRDPRIAQRATEAAWNARFIGAAIEAAGIWLAADAQSQQARQVLAALLINQSRLADAQPHLEKSLAADKENAGQSFMQLNALLARHPDKAAVLQLVQNLAKPYSTLPEAHFSIAQAALGAGQPELALNEVRESLRLRPDWEQAALLMGGLLQQRNSNGEAAAYFQDFLKRYPRAMDVRLNYARALVGEKKYPEARAEFQSLLKEFPDNPDVSLAVGLLSLQLGDFDLAETQLSRALENNYKDPDAVRFYLGQVSEERKRFDEALKWYASVSGGDQFVASRARYANVLVKQGRMAEAREYLQGAGRNAAERLQFIQIEAQLLREANDFKGAFDVLGRAVAANPNSAELLYDYAMVAEKVERFDVLETSLRKVIQLKPDHAHAHNALGYTLADRNMRLPEAYALIEQALKLSPEDPFILDSMGWVLYRMKQNDAALTFLKRAYEIRSDAEISAHYGEVLWIAGKQDEARKVWSGALKQSPANELLLATVKKFSP